ncbi:hypothetical protein CHS0354_028167 [Potamilus streckersoni]|uniref:Uncharacterized protein n=1 Tax=Potamilus streckersoni TaxID=2493646 RepID=A0AAE0WD05_9BIVA|nr:hypothetical protein CHS0354_028167 [Potamilus streckersoni]
MECENTNLVEETAQASKEMGRYKLDRDLRIEQGFDGQYQDKSPWHKLSSSTTHDRPTRKTTTGMKTNEKCYTPTNQETNEEFICGTADLS